MDRDGENAREGREVGSLRADRDDGNETILATLTSRQRLQICSALRDSSPLAMLGPRKHDGVSTSLRLRRAAHSRNLWLNSRTALDWTEDTWQTITLPRARVNDDDNAESTD